MPILVVANQKGGVGKTTTAISLAASLAQNHSRVLLVDLDPQGNATSGLGVEKSQAGVYDALIKGRPIVDLVVPTVVPGLHLLPSGPDMAGAEVELVPILARESRLRTALLGGASFEIVVIDCPPSLGLLTINALVAGDAVVIPVQCEYFALEGLAQLLQTINAVRERLNGELTVLGIVLTMEDRRNRLSMQVVDEVRRHFPSDVVQTRIPRSVRLAEAPSHGQPISMYDPQSRGAQAYVELARELEGRMSSLRPIALTGSA